MPQIKVFGSHRRPLPSNLPALVCGGTPQALIVKLGPAPVRGLNNKGSAFSFGWARCRDVPFYKACSWKVGFTVGYLLLYP